MTMTSSPPPPPTAPGTGDVAARAVDATKVYGEGDTVVNALAGVTVDFAAGQFAAIMGPSGSGKSTLMPVWPASTTSPRAAAGSREPTSPS
jgi:putative ABC transport system ATP-binding protein